MSELSEGQIQELTRLRGYFPFRIVCGCLNPQSGEFVALATGTMRQPNAYARKGWLVWRAA